MNLALDGATKLRIQMEIDLGHYSQPSEVVDHAMRLLEAEEAWLDSTRSSLESRLTESMAQIARGEGIEGDQVIKLLAKRRDQVTAHR